MGKTAMLEAADGHRFNVYIAEPTGSPRGVVIIVQEIFGVTDHIHKVAERYATAGYLVLVPSFFDRIHAKIELNADQFELARDYAAQLNDANTYADLAATLETASQAGKVAVIGYCWGGTVAYVAACRLPIAASVSYYGTRIQHCLNEHPRCPLQYHYGELDSFIPPATVAQIKAADPSGEFHSYPGAGHAFNNEQRADRYHPEAAQLAFTRTQNFLARHLS